MCDVGASMHLNEFMHGDIRAYNVLIDQNGKYKLLDPATFNINHD